MILSGTAIGFICVIALLLASLLLAILDKQEKGKGNRERSHFLSRLALGLFIAAFAGGAVMVLMSGIHPREDRKGMPGRPMAEAMGNNPPGQGGKMMPGAIGKVDQAELKKLEEKVAKNSKDVKSLERLGHLYLQMQDYENVFKIAHEALQTDPKSAESRAHMGMVLFSMQEMDQALEQMDKALAIDSKHLETLFFKGLIQFQGLGDPEGAKRPWQDFLKYSKPDDERRTMVEMFLQP